MLLLARRRHQVVTGSWRHAQAGCGCRNWLATAEQGHDVAAETLVVVVDVQLATFAAPAVVKLVLLK